MSEISHNTIFTGIFENIVEYICRFIFLPILTCTYVLMYICIILLLCRFKKAFLSPVFLELYNIHVDGYIRNLLHFNLRYG